MFDLGWSKLALIAVIALVVIGPRELPQVMRTLGTWTRKARALARDFQNGFDQMLREAELEQMRQSVAEVGRDLNPAGEIGELLSNPIETDPRRAQPHHPPRWPLAAEPPEASAAASTAPLSEPPHAVAKEITASSEAKAETSGADKVLPEDAVPPR
jgi:sec-independent protein translocase protein TatB